MGHMCGETSERASVDIINASNASLLRSVIGDARLAYVGSSARSYLSTGLGRVRRDPPAILSAIRYIDQHKSSPKVLSQLNVLDSPLATSARTVSIFV